jgi:hypothetical protein
MKLNFKETGIIFKLAMYILIIGTFSNLFILQAATFDIPKAAASIYVADTTQDGKLEIIIGHNHNFDTEWSGISIYHDTGFSEYSLEDSLYLYSGQKSIFALDVTDNGFTDIIAKKYENDIQYIAVMENDGNSFTDKYYPMDYVISDFITGDIDGDGDIDIVFYSNSGYFWGYMKNDGIGQFSSPVYYELDFPPGAIACGDANNDGKTDVVVGSGGRLSVFYWDAIWGLIGEDLETSINIYDLSVFDINNDNKNELIIVDGALFGSLMNIRFTSIDNDWNMNEYYRKNIDESLISFSIADLNNDNFSDIVYNAYSSDSTYVLYNENGESFADPVNYQTYFGDTSNYTSSIKSFVADIDGNTLNDIVTLNSSYAYDNDVTILFQTEEGDFVQNPQTGIENQDNLVSKIELYQNYPNPFNNETKIQFGLDSSSEVELSVYNGKGELVESLVQGRFGKGIHSVNYRTDGLTSGVYYYELKVNGVPVKVRKMLYLK